MLLFGFQLKNLHASLTLLNNNLKITTGLTFCIFASFFVAHPQKSGSPPDHKT